MRQRVWLSKWVLTGLALMVTLGLTGPAAAQDKPRAGGEAVHFLNRQLDTVWLSE